MTVLRDRLGRAYRYVRHRPRWKMVAVVAIAAVVGYGVFRAVEESQANGRRLDKALAALKHSNTQNDALVVLIGDQGDEIKGLRRALRQLGLTDKQIDEAIDQAQRQPGGPSGGGGGDPQPDPDPSKSPKPGHHPEPEPSKSPKPPDEKPPPPEEPCRAVNPLNGDCILRVPLPLPGAGTMRLTLGAW